MIWEVRCIEDFPEQLVGGVLDHFHFFKDNHPFPLEILLSKTRMGNDVGQQVDSLGKAGIRNLYREAGHLMGCIGVEMPT